MTEKINRLLFEHGGREYEITGGVDGTHPAPDSVDSSTIKDDSIEERDLSAAVRDKLDALDTATEITEDEIADIVAQACSAAGLDVPETQTNE